MRPSLKLFKDPVESFSWFLLFFPMLLSASLYAWNAYVLPHQELQGMMLTEDGEFIDKNARNKAEAQGDKFWLHQISEIQGRLNDPSVYELNPNAIDLKIQQNEERWTKKQKSLAEGIVRRRERLMESGRSDVMARESYRLENEIAFLNAKSEYVKRKERLVKRRLDVPIKREKLKSLIEEIRANRLSKK